ncbi:MAG: fibro-slime domain-containing protein [Planctomycetota bacterium]
MSPYDSDSQNRLSAHEDSADALIDRRESPRTTLSSRTNLYRALSVLAVAGLATAWMMKPVTPSTARASNNGAAVASDAEERDVMVLDAIIRDFRPRDAEGGHADFQAFSGTTTVGLVADRLGKDGRPAFSDARGKKIQSEYRDAEGRAINPALFDSSRGDVAGELVDGGSGNGFASEASFAQWYQDLPGVNLSKRTALELEFDAESGSYVFDSAKDEPYASIGGFFPINDDLYGNYSSGKNFHFTTEVRTEFLYRRGTGQVFTFTGDDDVWVYVDGRLVIDLGGLHPKREQTIDLDRLDWLVDGTMYPLDIFHAERRTSQSNFRIETTIQMKSLEMPPTSALFD